MRPKPGFSKFEVDNYLNSPDGLLKPPGEVCGLVYFHSDDLVGAGTREFKTMVLDRISSKFDVKWEELVEGKSLKNLGRAITMDANGDIFIDQSYKLDGIAELELPDVARESELYPDQTAYRSVVMTCLNIIQNTRPERAYAQKL